jgi:hypothetical protein
MAAWLAAGVVAAADQPTAPAASAAATSLVSASGTLHVQPGAGDGGKPIRLVGRHARQQLALTAKLSAEQVRDVTRAVTYAVEPAGIIQVDKHGMVTPLADGSATVTAKNPADDATVSVPFAVEQFGATIPVNFVNEVIPVFTKAGCNGGGCHGKSGGQNGFKLSLLGFEPTEDYTHLVHEARARRLSVATPERSLLLTKADNETPHGGGKRLDAGSDDYKTLVRWIKQGMPYGKDSDPRVASIAVYPKTRTLPMGGNQQLVVTAQYTDGSTRDVTRGAVFEASDKELGEVDATGWLSVNHKPGTVSVMVRYQGQVGVFQAVLPLGAPVETLPPVKNYIDELVFKQLKQVGMPPSAVCDDSTFIRRVTLDVAGRLPTPAEVTAFLADTDAAKRDKLIDRLVDSGDYADYFANKWSALLRNKRETPNQARGNYAFHGWIRDSLYRNKPFDQFAREVIAAAGDSSTNPAVGWYRGAKTTQIQLEDTAQLFLGTRLQCAQCHHHPYEKWSQRDYYGMAAFYSTVDRQTGSWPGELIVYTKRAVASAVNKKDQKPVPPTALGAAPVELTKDQDPRQALADWMARPDNKFFAPSLVNRYWKHFFGRGLVDPEDDIRETNPPTNPELLDALAKDFVASKFDLKHLVRTICRSSTYQLSSVPNRYNAADKQSFSRYYPRRMNAEVLLDAVDQVTAGKTAFANLPASTRAVQLPDNSFNASSYFLTVFGRPESSSACECERSMDASLAQSLHLFNSADVQTKLTADTGRAAALVKEPAKDEDKVRELYLWAFARQPDAEELKLASQHLARERKDKDGKPLAPDAAKRQAYEDLLWALINTKEFLFNH